MLPRALDQTLGWSTAVQTTGITNLLTQSPTRADTVCPGVFKLGIAGGPLLVGAAWVASASWCSRCPTAPT